MRHLFIVLFLLALAPPLVVAQSVTIGGTVRDKMTLLPVSSASVDLTNPLNPAEHYSMGTDLTGQ